MEKWIKQWIIYAYKWIEKLLKQNLLIFFIRNERCVVDLGWQNFKEITQ